MHIIRGVILPIFLGAGCWAVGAAFLPLSTVVHFAALTGVSVVVYVLSLKAFAPQKVVQKVEAKEKKAVAKDGQSNRKAELKQKADEVIEIGRRYIERLKTADNLIEDADISAQIVKMGEISKKIFEVVRREPEKASEIRKFINYYFPTTIKLLQSYADMDETILKGANIDRVKESVAAITDKIVLAFENQLDRLYANEALDIDSEIDVLEAMMKKDGFDKNKA